MEKQAKTVQKKAKSLGELEDKYFGKIGTPKRETYEEKIKLDIIGELLKQMREEKHLTQAQLAKKLGMDTTYVSKIENNLKTQRIDTIVKVIKVLKGQLFIRVHGEHGPTDVELV
jgi:HTH-type transcriptional regulator/antitoxin HipB